MKVDVDGGKYTVVFDDGPLRALRHGEAWRDLLGDSLVFNLAYELHETRQQRDMLREALEKVVMRIEGDLCQTVRDVINGLADANDVYDDVENIDGIARAALKEVNNER